MYHFIPTLSSPVPWGRLLQSAQKKYNPQAKQEDGDHRQRVGQGTRKHRSCAAKLAEWTKPIPRRVVAPTLFDMAIKASPINVSGLRVWAEGGREDGGMGPDFGVTPDDQECLPPSLLSVLSLGRCRVDGNMQICFLSGDAPSPQGWH